MVGNCLCLAALKKVMDNPVSAINLTKFFIKRIPTLVSVITETGVMPLLLPVRVQLAVHNEKYRGHLSRQVVFRDVSLLKAQTKVWISMKSGFRWIS